MEHVAFKCNYNDGGEGEFVGFSGICSTDNIIYNIEEAKATWCSNERCFCRNYYDNAFDGKIRKFPCLESRLFSNSADNYYGPGARDNGQPILMRKIEVGKIVFLTTRFPSDDEKNRKIIGCYRISKIVVPPKSNSVHLHVDENFRIRLSLEEAKQLFYWDYYRNKGPRQSVWSMGFRYLSDEIACQILSDFFETLNDPKMKKLVTRILETDFKGVPRTEPTGARTDIISPVPPPNGSGDEGEGEIDKYPGGEGEDHKQLKEWIAIHPKKIGLTKVRDTELEHIFPSGDAVDILFQMKDGTDAVVEIETNFPIPGSWQAIKYRALRCAERALKLNSKKVKAILVAWKIPDALREFCKNYNIDCFEIKLP